MTPTAEWYEADADDSDRSISDDVTANTPETAHAATETGENGARVHGDADLLRKRTAALDRVAAENERLREQASRADAAEAKLHDVEALADEWEGSASFSRRMASGFPRSSLNEQIALQAAEVNEGNASSLRAVLARSQAPQAPAEQEGPTVESLTPGGVTVDLIERFRAKYVISKTGCWLWTAHINQDGYGGFGINRRWFKAHRAAYILLGESFAAVNAAKTRCIHGHEFTPENTYFDKYGWRKCRECRAVVSARRWAAKKAARATADDEGVRRG